tara:strand:- start:622 stop:1116 length:495 start_codon:yes stop_codon:yes gene_type:complete
MKKKSSYTTEISVLLVCITIIIVSYLFVSKPNYYLYPKQKQIQVYSRPGVGYTNEPKDTLLNPYAPPLRYNEPNEYKQIGYLKSNTEQLYPLFGKPSQLKRDKWYYYTIHQNIKVSLFLNNRDCSTEQGCDSLNNGDIVSVDGIHDHLQVSLYKNNSLVYNPFV